MGSEKTEGDIISNDSIMQYPKGSKYEWRSIKDVAPSSALFQSKGFFSPETLRCNNEEISNPHLLTAIHAVANYDKLFKTQIMMKMVQEVSESLIQVKLNFNGANRSLLMDDSIVVDTKDGKNQMVDI